jgi:IPT/TIG domain-containing protein
MRRTLRAVERTVVVLVVLATTFVLITPTAWAAAPNITSFTPASGPVGTVVTINGKGFNRATEVAFTAGAIAPTYSVDSNTQITVTVPLGSTTGPISVTSPGGTGTSPTNFTVRAKVVGTSLVETEPAASSGYLAWAQNSAAHPNRLDAYARAWGDPKKFKVNAVHTAGELGGIDETTLVYQQYSPRGGASDIKRFDLDTHVRSNAPAGVNTKYWEDWPSISGHWLLFGRTLASGLESGKKRVILFNTTTGRSRTLAATSTSKPFLIPDQVSGDFAVWERFTGSACDVFRYRISSKRTIRIPNPDNKCQYASSVTSDGTVYYMRSRSAFDCGVSVSLRTYPSVNPTLVSLPKGKDVFDTYAVANENGSTTIFYDQGSCSTGNQDILEVTISP